MSGHDYVTVDTEFMRESTFWPELCLIQIGYEDGEYIIDPLAAEMSLEPFFELMANQNITKVFHAARQDVEIIYHLAKIIPAPLFDTQIAAMVCGFGESISYSALVKKYLRFDLDKSSRFTDWSRRPLSDKQTKYAIGDVTHLRVIYKNLLEQLDKTNRAHWLKEEMDILTAPATYDQHPEDAWRRLKMRVKTPKALGIMVELAAWREQMAQKQNVPRGRIIRDDAIYDIANQAPKNQVDLANLRSINDGFARSSKGRDVVEAVKKGLARDPKTLPPLKKGVPLPAEASAVMDLLRVLLKAASAQHGVASKLIATADDLEKLAVYDDADIAALKGWRRELFGQDALALKGGQLALSIIEGKIKPTLLS